MEPRVSPSASPFDLFGQVAVVTGSSRGIGRSIAETMARMGAKVVISSRKADACDAVAADIRRNGGEAIVVACNVARRGDVEHLVKATHDAFGRIDCMVANAAVSPYFGPMSDMDDAVFDKLMNVNVKSTLWLANLVRPGMAAQGGGSIIIVSSIAGIRSTGNLGGYGVSKAADFGVARALAVEWGPMNIRINCIAPGLVKTDFAKALWEDEKRLAKRLETTPLRRIGQPEDIGGVAAFLASPAGSFITGQVIVADGGITIA
jgi:NAD(P)-dependent dehydrogenase (short-subunit alcohol dehydrogenase family)